jgi:co-chaperonin GroES (HSP10)
MKFQPLHDCVVIRRVEQEARTTGGDIPRATIGLAKKKAA